MGLGAGLQVASSLGKSLYGATQLIGNKRPDDYTYNIPSEVMEALTMAKSRMGDPLPGAALERERIGQVTASGMATLSDKGGSSGATLGAATELLGKQYQALNALNIQEANAAIDAEGRVTNQLANVANYKDQAFDENVRRPYNQRLAEFFERRSSGSSNLFGGLSEAGGQMVAGEERKMLMEELGIGGGSGGGIGDVDMASMIKILRMVI